MADLNGSQSQNSVNLNQPVATTNPVPTSSSQPAPSVAPTYSPIGATGTVPGNSLQNEINPATGVSNQASPTSVPANFGVSGGQSTKDISLPTSTSPNQVQAELNVITKEGSAATSDQPIGEKTMPFAPPMPVTSDTSVSSNPLPNQVNMSDPSTAIPPAPITTQGNNLLPSAPTSQVPPANPTAALGTNPSSVQMVSGPAGDLSGPKSGYSPFIDDDEDELPKTPVDKNLSENKSDPNLASKSEQAPETKAVVPENIVSKEEPSLDKPSVNPVGDSVSTAQAATPASELMPAENQGNKKSKLAPIILGIVGAIIIAIAGIVALTEMGIMSLGFEKAYGTVGLERLWGGLSIKSETALAQSMSVMKSVKDFKVTGTVNLTIDKTVDNTVTKELISKINQNVLHKDTPILSDIVTAAILAVEETTEEDYLLEDEEDSSSTSSTSSYDYESLLQEDETSSSSTLYLTSSSSSSSSTEQTDYPAYIAKSSQSLKTVESTISASFSEEGMEADIVTSRSVGSAGLSLIMRDGMIATKSDNLQFDDNAGTDWSSYDFLEGDDASGQIFAISEYDGVSVTGSRISTEKIGNDLCYKYQINSLEIGEALLDMGVEGEMIQSISGSVWIAIKTKQLTKIDLKINLGPGMAITQINASLTLSGFGETNDIAAISISDTEESEESLYNDESSATEGGGESTSLTEDDESGSSDEEDASAESMLLEEDETY